MCARILRPFFVRKADDALHGMEPDFISGFSSPVFFPSPLSLASRDFPFFFDGSFSFNPASRSVVFFKSPLPVASPLPPEDSAAAFFSAISASSFFVKKRPPAPRSRRCAWLCLDSCRYGFRDLMSLVLQNKKVSRQYASKCYG